MYIHKDKIENCPELCFHDQKLAVLEMTELIIIAHVLMFFCFIWMTNKMKTHLIYHHFIFISLN